PVCRDCSSHHTPPPPPSILLPYTTLFRSDRHCAGQKRRCRRYLDASDRGDHPGRRLHLRADALGVQGRGGSQRLRGAEEGGRRRDRKSTRLNSSHGSISYAVFCLKKQKL